MMNLSEIDDTNLSDEEIENIVFGGISYEDECTMYGLVFGNSMLIDERVNTAVDAYKTGKIKKIIFSGGSNGISNQEENVVPEAIRMRDLAIKMGIPAADIFVEDQSNNTFENIRNTFALFDSASLSEIALISSEFHLKRCLAIIKKEYPHIRVVLIPSYDGFSDKDDWRLSDMSWNSGRSLVTYEAKLLIKYAREGKIFDLVVKR